MDSSYLLPLMLSLGVNQASQSSAGSSSTSDTASGFNDLFKNMLVNSLMDSQTSMMSGLSGTSDSSSSLFGTGGMSSMGSSSFMAPLLMALATSSKTGETDTDTNKLLPVLMLSMMSGLGNSNSSLLGSTEDSSSLGSSSGLSGLGGSFMAPVMMTLLEKLLSNTLSSNTTSTSSGYNRSTSMQAALNAYGSTSTTPALKSTHINQFDAELQVGGDGTNANCGPTSLVMALRSLGLNVSGETSSTTDGKTIELARLSMVTDLTRDGIDSSGQRSETENSTFTYLDDIIRGANASGARAVSITPSANSIREALDQGARIVVSGTFENKSSLPWSGDRGVDNYSAPGGSGKHIIAVTAYDEHSHTFLVHDPARSTPLMVTASALEQFMAGNAGAVAITKT